MDSINNVDLLEGISQNAHFVKISQSQKGGKGKTQLVKSVRVYALLNSTVDQKYVSLKFPHLLTKNPRIVALLLVL